ncbi:MAG TPA: hypothetical protein VMX35_08710 [Acidobacteriota bacterium]|nr:hypothetical protein [Acidobacteriota bacterium]
MTVIEKDQVWRNLLEYIDSQELFLPSRVRSRLNPEAESIFEEFIGLMLCNKMIIPFKKKNLTNRIAHWIFWLRTKLFSRDRKVPTIYVIGPCWKEPGGQSLDEILNAEAGKE